MFSGHQVPEKGDDQMQIPFQTPVNSDLVKESGTVTIASAPVNGNGYADVAFRCQYGAAPVVIATVQSASSSNVVPSCYNVTANGCRIYIRNNHTSALTDVVVGYAVIDNTPS